MRSSKRARNNPPATRQGGIPATPPASSTTQTVVTHSEQYWQGPLPHPQTLEDFRQVVDDAPERIIAQWEAESAHRRQYEITALHGQIKKDHRGQVFAILFALGALALAAVSVIFDQPWVAAVIGSGTIASVVGAFLYQRQAQRLKK